MGRNTLSYIKTELNKFLAAGEGQDHYARGRAAGLLEVKKQLQAELKKKEDEEEERRWSSGYYDTR